MIRQHSSAASARTERLTSPSSTAASTSARRHTGNTPQALSHLALVRAADAVHAAGG